MERIVECIPNFSEGRRSEVVDAIVAAIESVKGVVMLASEMDPSHNRSVITFVGEPEACVEAAVRAAGRAGLRAGNRDRDHLVAAQGKLPRTAGSGSGPGSAPRAGHGPGPADEPGSRQPVAVPPGQLGDQQMSLPPAPGGENGQAVIARDMRPGEGQVT